MFKLDNATCHKDVADIAADIKITEREADDLWLSERTFGLKYLAPQLTVDNECCNLWCTVTFCGGVWRCVTGVSLRCVALRMWWDVS